MQSHLDVENERFRTSVASQSQATPISVFKTILIILSTWLTIGFDLPCWEDYTFGLFKITT